jgi:hypothetical protein
VLSSREFEIIVAEDGESAAVRALVELRTQSLVKRKKFLLEYSMF